MSNTSLNLINNLLHITNRQGGTIHQYLNLSIDNDLTFFKYMNKKILSFGFLSKDDLIQEAKKFNVTIKDI